MHHRHKALCFILLSISCSGSLRAEQPAYIGGAGDNQQEIVSALQKITPEQRDGLVFLLKHMPESDLKTLKADFLLQNVDFAYRARNSFVWAKEVPEEIFLNDVLPYASLDERRDNWRGDFYKRFSNVVKEAKSLDEACLLVNKQIKEVVKVEYNTKRKKPNQSPYESMEQGMASCSGLSILLVDALRSVGIPARVAGIPAWTTKHGNHNWVEYWSPKDKQWHFIEYYPDAKGPDHSWFVADAQQANPKSFIHSIYATSWKSTGIHFPMVWDMESKMVPGVNVTERYLSKDPTADKDLCELRIDFTNESGTRETIDIRVVQGDVVLHQGKTPGPEDDMNRFFQAKVKKEQLYQIVWTVDGQTTPQIKEIKPTKDDGWLNVKLGAGKAN
ncbi:hypothetical protein Rhal01_00412 [Rubritalea halochordaticola]|uniref:Transglutaminase-like domain-containing protein n=1 Tax=Rubritalea halochordaticola TaxID=714537 RepID=A0ABP9UUW8_9BACT